MSFPEMNGERAVFEERRPFVGRFAPSPTGRMHAGNVYSALVAWIIARRQGGRVVLRIEDLDTQRSKAEFADAVMRDFENLGLWWDGEPVYQSNRTQAYQEAFEQLLDADLLYPCYCTRADLHAASAPHVGEKPVYAGTCRLADPSELEKRKNRALEQGREPSWRVIVPDRVVEIDDMFQGHFVQRLKRECGDFVVRRSDGAFAYQLAVVVDDAYQGVTSVVRGVDLLSSSPQQRFLQDMLGLEHVGYAHVPLLMGADGHRLSKRHKDANLECLLQAYGSVEGVLGHIAYLAGLIEADEPASAEELLRCADLSVLERKEAILWKR